MRKITLVIVLFLLHFVSNTPLLLIADHTRNALIAHDVSLEDDPVVSSVFLFNIRRVIDIIFPHSLKGDDFASFNEYAKFFDIDEDMEHRILKKNKSFHKQLFKDNTIYEIRYNFNLGGREVTIPPNCTLFFNGGSIDNGTIIGQNTRVEGDNYEIFKHGSLKYKAYKNKDGFDIAGEICKRVSGVLLSGTFYSSSVKSNWTGLSNVFDESADGALMNYIRLHGELTPIVVPHNEYYIFSIGVIKQSIDFSNSVLYLIKPALVYDETIEIPSGTEEIELTVPRWMLAFSKTDGVLENVSINGMFKEYLPANMTLGSRAAIELFSNKNITLKNVRIFNYGECAIITHTGINNNLYLNNIELDTIGEHGIYCHSQGDIVIENSKFINCSYNTQLSNRLGAFIRFVGTKEFNVGSFVNLYVTDTYFYRDEGFINTNGAEITNNMKKCLISYGGPVLYSFDGCVFDGKGILGPVINGAESGYYEREITFIFKNSTNIPFIYANNNHCRYNYMAYDCEGIARPFDFTYIENSTCSLSYSDVTSNVDSDDDLSTREYINCRFIETDNVNRIKIYTKNTIYLLRDCVFYSVTNKHYNGVLLQLQDVNNIRFHLINCVYDIPVKLFQIFAKGDNTHYLYMKDCIINSDDGTGLVKTYPEGNYHLSIENVNYKGFINDVAGLGILMTSRGANNYTIIHPDTTD